MNDDYYRDNGWFEVETTYYDSPREDCSGYYTSSSFYPTAKEAWYSAFHMNRQDEPRISSAYLNSPNSRVYKVFVNSKEILSTCEITRFWKEIKLWRELKRKLNDKNLSYSFKIL